jgi:hypothetical protein
VTEQAGTKGMIIDLFSRMAKQDAPAEDSGIVDISHRADGKVSA